MGKFIAAILLLFGVAAQFGALLVVAQMAAAICLVHIHKGFFVQNGGYEYPLNLLILAIVVIIAGPGRWYVWDPFLLMK